LDGTVQFKEILPMGSTAPFDKLKKKKKTVITLKKLLSEVAEPGVKMGNLCSLGAAAKKVPTPPHNLEDLLYEMQIKADVTSSSVDTLIESNHWAKMFRQYLKERKLSDDENIFRFLVLIHPLKLHPINNNQTQILGQNKILKPLSPEETQRLFTDIFQTFLSEDSDNVLPLSNQALWADLLATHSSLQKKVPVSNESLNEILKVRKDPGIWDDGIEPSYMRFLKQAPPPTLAACILSIL